MGNLFGGAKKESSNQTQQQQTSGSSNGSYSAMPVFDPNAYGTINALGGMASNLGGAGNTAEGYLTQMLSGGGMNPYAERVVEGQNRLAGAEFDKRLAGVRSSGYGGGIGRDVIDQGMFVSDFTNRQYDANARTLLDAWNADQNNRLGATSQLGGLDSTRLQSALSFLNNMRGETGNQTQQQTGTSNTQAKGTTKAISGGFNIGFGQ